jgi:hypothetical protein
VKGQIISNYHDAVGSKGALFQPEKSEEEEGKRSYQVGEAVGQLAVVLSKMKNALIDGYIFEPEFKNLEHNNKWDIQHIFMLKDMVAFFAGQELDVVVPTEFAFSEDVITTIRSFATPLKQLPSWVTRK